MLEASAYDRTLNIPDENGFSDYTKLQAHSNELFA